MKRIKSHLLTKEHDSLILNNKNNPKSTLNNVNKTVINKLQSVAWEINEDVLYYIEDTLKPAVGLTAIEARERETAFTIRDAETDTVIDYLLENGNKFYFGWKYDKRGRSYSQGYHVNPQGNAYRKAMLSYADKEMLTEEGIKYLKYDIANHLGYDKETWFKRTVEANKVIAQIFQDNELSEYIMLEIAEKVPEPELFIKAIYTYYRGVILGEPIGHNMGLDCTASGLQLMSAMACCSTTAENSNVHPKIVRNYSEEMLEMLAEFEERLENCTNKYEKALLLSNIRAIKTNPDNYIEQIVRADPYTLVAQRMVEKLPHTEVFEGMTFSQIRKYCKNPIMTAMYNSRQEPINAFGEDTQELQAFYDTLQELFPGAMNVLEALNDRWDDEAMYHTWTTPDGHVAHVDVTEKVKGTLESEGLKLEYTYWDNKPSKTRTSLAPNFTHSLDAFCIRHVIDNADFTVTHIHDDYQCHPNNMGKVRELYLDAIRIIAEGSYLEDFCKQDFGIDRKEFIAKLKDSSYALC